MGVLGERFVVIGLAALGLPLGLASPPAALVLASVVDATGFDCFAAR